KPIAKSSGSALHLVASFLLACAAACAGGCSSGAQPVDERLLLGLEEARAHQHRANLLLDGGDVQTAIDEVRAVLAVPFPSGSHEGEEARLDAHARLARLLLAQGNDADATGEIERGRKEATSDSFFRAHLETVAGEILEARAKKLAQSDTTQSRALQRE